MKKTLLFLMFWATVAFGISGQSTLRPRGDANCDWEINIADINVVIDIILGKTHYQDYFDKDVNGDGEVNIADVNALIGAVLGDELPPMPAFSGTLPVLYINTEGHREITGKDNSDYIHADWWLDNRGIEGCQSLGSPQHPLGMQIKGRGNYTWEHSAKKPYRIKLDTKQPLMGLKKNRHFCLLAHDFWSNPVGFELSRRIGLAYTPAQEPVEVVLNGIYIGLYFITEKIRVSTYRVNITEQENGETDENLITGGWLIEIDGHADENQFFIQESNGNVLPVKYHSPDSLSDAQMDYIYNLISQTDKAIYEGTDCEWEKYIDLDTLACFYIVNEVVDDIESFKGSLFLHKHRGDSTKLLFGPVWDFGCAFGHPEQEEPCFLYENVDEIFKPHWLEKMVQSDKFQEVVRNHWRDFYPSQIETIENYIDSIINRISSASKADRMRWPGQYWESLDFQNEYFKMRMREKVNFLNDQWGT
ncbi:MAG: CotH kinase family protein [Muribaculaceae bacterium]|nr:CotH kinase family protein [Muribaculaceae bacterium]